MNSLVSNDQWVQEIYHCLGLVADINTEEAYKINFSLGFILVHRESAEYRYFTPHNNNAFFKTPMRIDRPSSWREVYEQLTHEALISHVTQHREDTKWVPIMVTHIVANLFYLGVTMGAGKLADYVKQCRSIVALDKDSKGVPYEDNLCPLRALAYHYNLQEKGVGYRGLKVRMRELQGQWRQDGLDLQDVPHFESQFTISIDIFTLCEDGSVVPRYLSDNSYPDKMVLNLYDTHLSYVINVPAYLQKYSCDSCGRHFDHLNNWRHHQGCCVNATQYKFPGGFHRNTPSIFDRLKEFDIIVPIDDQLYPWYIVYDFEAVLSRIREDQTTPNLKWLRRHDPISVSVASNVEGYTEPRSFVELDPKDLIADMVDYMGDISDHIYQEAKEKWKYIFDELEKRLAPMAGYDSVLMETRRKKKKKKNKKKKTVRIYLKLPWLMRKLLTENGAAPMISWRHCNCHSTTIVDRSRYLALTVHNMI